MSLVTDPDIALRGEIDALPGGPLATLLRAREAGLTARLEANGTQSTGDGDLEVFVGETRAGTSALEWSDGQLTMRGQISPSAWQDFAQVERLAGGGMAFSIAVPLGEGGLLDPQLDGVEGEIRAPRLSLTAARHEDGIALQVREAAGLVNALLPDNTQAGSLAADGVLTPARDGSPLAFEGRVAGEGLILPIGTIERAAGPVRLEGPFDRLSVTSALQTRGAALEPEIVQTLTGATPGLDSELIWDGEARRLEIVSARLGGASGLSLTGNGRVDVPAERVALSLRYDALAIGAVTEAVTGTSSGSAELDINFDGTGNFTLNGTAQELGRDLGTRIGGEAQFSASGERRADGTLALDALQIDAPNLVAEAQGRSGPQGWDVSGQAAWSGGAPLAALVLDGTVSIAFEASDRDDVLQIRADASAPRAGAGPVVVEDARLRLEGEGPPDAFDGAWRLTGQTATGPVDIGGRASREGERADLTGIEGRFGGFNFTGGLQAEGSRIGGALNATPVNGFGTADIAFRVADGTVQGRIRAEDMVGEDLSYLDRLAFDAEGRTDDIRFTLEAEGAYGARALISLDGRFVSAETGGTLDFGLIGRYGGVRIATRERAQIRFGEDGLTARLGLGLNRGTLDAAIRSGDDRLELDLDAVNIPASLLSYPSGREPVGGTLSGEADFSRDGGIWTGTASLQADAITPPESQSTSDTDIAVSGTLSMMLDEAGARLEARADGSGLSGRADLQLQSGPVTRADILTAPGTGLQGSAELDGDVETLAAFRLAEGQSLAGRARMSAELAGSVGSPDLEGTLSMQGGRFDDAALGISVRELNLSGVFAQDGFEISSLQASSADGGQLTGSGRLSLADASVTGQAELEFSDFLIIERPDLTAAGGGNVIFDIEDDRIAISGETRLSRAEVRPPEASRPVIALV